MTYDVQFLIGFVIFVAVLVIIGVLLVRWLYPAVFPLNVRQPIAIATIVILVLLALSSLLGWMPMPWHRPSVLP